MADKPGDIVNIENISKILVVFTQRLFTSRNSYTNRQRQSSWLGEREREREEPGEGAGLHISSKDSNSLPTEAMRNTCLPLFI